MGKLDGRTAIIPGAARGQGRAHALALSEEGATIVACNVAEQIVGVPYAMATKPDLDDTARLVTEQGGRCTTERVDGGTVYTVGDETGHRPCQQH